NNDAIAIENGWIAIANRGMFVNNDLIEMQTMSRSSIFNNGDFTNNAEIFIDDVDEELFPGLRNLKTFTNSSTGEIFMSDLNCTGLSNFGSPNGSATFNNDGRIEIENTGSFYAINNSVLETWNNNGTLKVTGTSKGIANSSEFYLNNDTLIVPQFTNFDFGKLFIGDNQEKELVITGDMDNRGTIVCSASSPTVHDTLSILGNLECEGTAELRFNFVPSLGLDVEIIKANSISGYFETLTKIPFWNDISLDYSRFPSIYAVINDCGNAKKVNAFIPNSGSWNDPSNWSLGHLPLPCETVSIVGNGTTKSVSLYSDPTIRSLELDNAVLNIFSSSDFIIDGNFFRSGGQGLK
ncbi:MAG: hypothetical protein AAGK97_18020, partial [Bacteroidota bacterium]